MKTPDPGSGSDPGSRLETSSDDSVLPIKTDGGVWMRRRFTVLAAVRPAGSGLVNRLFLFGLYRFLTNIRAYQWLFGTESSPPRNTGSRIRYAPSVSIVRQPGHGAHGSSRATDKHPDRPMAKVMYHFGSSSAPSTEGPLPIHQRCAIEPESTRLSTIQRPFRQPNAPDPSHITRADLIPTFHIALLEL